VRLKEDWWLKVKDFTESGERERTVTFALPKRDRAKLKDFPQMLNTEITCRLIKVELENGEREVLCTSLEDSATYPHGEFEQLYHYRWNEEEAYKLLKDRIELEDFSGKTAKAVRQDFHAKVFLITLCAAYAHPIAERVIAEYRADRERKHDQKINRTNALATTMDMLVPALIHKKYKETLDAFDSLVWNTREIIRPGRSNPRNKRQKKPYSMNYKRL